MIAWANPENLVRGGPDIFFRHQHISQRAVRHLGSNCFSRGFRTSKTKMLNFLASKLSEIVFITLINDCWQFNIYEHDQIHAQLNMKSFIISGPGVYII